MKTLKTKKLNLAICWNGLRNMPPKDFPSIDEMEKTSDILDAFKEVVPEFVNILEEGEKLNASIQSGKIQPEEIMAKKTEFQKTSNAIEAKEGNVEAKVEFENEIFNTFFQQFERWGKNWFVKLEPFLAFRKDMTTTNQQSKGK